jgi:hypothetical protein
LLFQFIFDKRYTLFSRVERMRPADKSIRNLPAEIVDSPGCIDLSARPISF